MLLIMLHYASIMLYAFHAKNNAGIIDASLHATDLKFSHNASINNVTKVEADCAFLH